MKMIVYIKFNVGWALAQQRAQRTIICQMKRYALLLGQGPTYIKIAYNHGLVFGN